MSKANTYDERMEMVRMYNETGDTAAIAERYGLSVRTVQKRLNEMGVKLKRGAGGNKGKGTVAKAAAPVQTELALDKAPAPRLPTQQTMHVTDDQIMLLDACQKRGITHAGLIELLAQPAFNRNNIINALASFNDQEMGHFIRQVYEIAAQKAEAERKEVSTDEPV